MKPAWSDHIESDPTVLRGKPCVRGTRIPVTLILGYLAAAKSVDQILVEFPDSTTEDVTAALDYARDLVG